MEHIIPIVLIVAILGGAIAYLIRAKKRGQRCVGCPHSKTCSGGCSCDSK